MEKEYQENIDLLNLICEDRIWYFLSLLRDKHRLANAMNLLNDNPLNENYLQMVQSSFFKKLEHHFISRKFREGLLYFSEQIEVNKRLQENQKKEDSEKKIHPSSLNIEQLFKKTIKLTFSSFFHLERAGIRYKIELNKLVDEHTDRDQIKDNLEARYIKNIRLLELIRLLEKSKEFKNFKNFRIYFELVSEFIFHTLLQDERIAQRFFKIREKKVKNRNNYNRVTFKSLFKDTDSFNKIINVLEENDYIKKEGDKWFWIHPKIGNNTAQKVMSVLYFLLQDLGYIIEAGVKHENPYTQKAIAESISAFFNESLSGASFGAYIRRKDKLDSIDIRDIKLDLKVFIPPRDK